MSYRKGGFLRHRIVRRTFRQQHPRGLVTSRVEPLESRCLLSSYVVNTLVDQTDPPGSATVSLRDAISQANSASAPNTITFAPAVRGAIKLVNGQLEISGSMSITGPGADQLSIDAQNQSRVFLIDLSANATISGLTMTNGRPGNFNDGGAILNNGTLKLTNDVISQSTAGNGATDQPGRYGGGVYNAGTLTVTGSTFSGDVAGNGGSGMGQGGQGDQGGDGGWGGGIYSLGTLTVLNSTFSGDVAGAGGQGGHGYTSVGGDGIGGDGGYGGSGGGIANSGAATLINVTLSQNTAGPRGPAGIGDDFPGIPGLSGEGAAIANLGTFNIGNTITSASSISPGDAAGSFNSLGHNLISASDQSSGWIASDQTGTSSAPLDPMLGPLGLNGGGTPTYPLLSGSPAIDRGDNALANQYGLTTDQRGMTRISNGTVDVGSFEVQVQAAGVPGDVNHDGVVNFTDLMILARHFGQNVAANQNGDLNGDGVVNLADLLILAHNFGRTGAATAVATAQVQPQATILGTLHRIRKPGHAHHHHRAR